MLESLWLDIRHALRTLGRAPRHSAVAIAILAIGIGSNTTMFSAIDHVLLRPLPFPDADRLLRLRDQITGADGFLHPFNMSARNVLAVREHAAVFDGVIAMGSDSMTLFAGEQPSRLSVVLQSGDYEKTLAVQPMLGRLFTADDQRLGGVAIVSHALWQARLGGSPQVIGSSIRLDNSSYTIVGVMPPLYAFPYEAQVWLPIVLDPADQTHDFAVWGRVRRGETAASVRASLDATAAEIRRTIPGTLPSYSIETMTIRRNLLDAQDAPLRALSAIMAFLLLIGCVNVSALLLARAVTRRREFAVRAALGATVAQHVRQLLAESLVLAACGCAAGLILSVWLAPASARLIPGVLSEQLGLVTLRTDWRVASFAAVVSVASAVLAGALPALGSWRSNPRDALGDGGRTIGGVRGHHLLGSLIVAETALTLVLVVGAGLVIENFVRLQNTRLGFQAPGLLALELTPSTARYGSGAARAALMRRLVDEIDAEPGVVHAAITTVNPLGGGTWGATVISEAAAAVDPAAAFNVNHRLITPGLFETMGITLIRGRGFTDQDRAGTEPVAIVSERMAQRLWPAVDPIGQRVRIARADRPWLTVVGVAADVSDSHDPGVPLETWYLPYAQNADSAAAEHVYVMARSRGDALAMTTPVERAIGRVDGTLAPYNPVAMDRYRADSIRRERVSAGFMLASGVFGIVLAALGVYGVMAFSVGQRTVEFGVRMALGAGAADIVPLVLRRSLRLVGLGVAAGAVVAVAVNRVMASMLTEVGRLDVSMLVFAVIAILATAVAACLTPALRAARLDPMQALKSA